MSEETKQPAENREVVRKLVVPSEAQVEAKDGDRSPTKDRDLTVEAVAEADVATTSNKGEAVRKLVLNRNLNKPQPQCEESN